MLKHYYVYIVTNASKALYTGVTRDLRRRVHEHRRRAGSVFAARYNITQLAYYEECTCIRDALAREKQIKGWRRAKKIALIEELNPTWQDLSAAW